MGNCIRCDSPKRADPYTLCGPCLLIRNPEAYEKLRAERLLEIEKHVIKCWNCKKRLNGWPEADGFVECAFCGCRTKTLRENSDEQRRQTL